MKHLLITLFLAIVCGVSYCADLKNINYKDISLSDPLTYARMAKDLDKKLAANIRNDGYSPLSSKTLPEVYFANQVYVKDNSKLMFKLGVIYPKKFNEKYVPFKNGYLYHFTNKVPVAIYGEFVSKAQMKKFVRKIKRTFKKIKKSKQVSMLHKISLISSAHADTSSCVSNGYSLPVIDVSEYDKVNNHVKTNFIMSVASDCFMTAIKAAWNATGGFIEDVGSGIWNFIKSPVKSVTKAWDGAVNMVNTTTKFFANIKENLKKVGSALAGLSSKMISTIMCAISGSLGGEHLLKMLVNPAVGMALLIPKVIKMFNRITKSAKALAIIDKIKLKGASASSAVMNILYKGSDAFRRRVNTLADNGLNKLTLRYASCGI